MNMACMKEAPRYVMLGHGRVSCLLEAGHAGAHCLTDPLMMDASVSQRWLENGVVHHVVWFNWHHSARKRELWTACGMARDTTNRTKNNRSVTCLRCIACPS